MFNLATLLLNEADETDKNYDEPMKLLIQSKNIKISVQLLYMLIYIKNCKINLEIIKKEIRKLKMYSDELANIIYQNNYINSWIQNEAFLFIL